MDFEDDDVFNGIPDVGMEDAEQEHVHAFMSPLSDDDKPVTPSTQEFLQNVREIVMPEVILGGELPGAQPEGARLPMVAPSPPVSQCVLKESPRRQVAPKQKKARPTAAKDSALPPDLTESSPLAGTLETTSVYNREPNFQML